LLVVHIGRVEFHHGDVGVSIEDEKAAETGAWQLVDTTVYALTENTGSFRSRRTTPFVNKFTATVQRGPNCTDEEALAVASIMRMAPDLAKSLSSLLDVGYNPISANDRVDIIKARDEALGLMDQFQAHMAVLEGKQESDAPAP
jgi:hypothetical protein